MGVGTLRDDLLSLPGVEQAEIDGDSIAPAGVRVRLSPGVDPAAIGDEIRRVLSMHGLRQENGAVAAGEDSTPATWDEADAAMWDESDDVEPLDDGGELRGPEPRVSEAPALPGADLDWVSITEGRDGIQVAAGSGSTEVSTRSAGPSGAAIDQAVLSVVAELAGSVALPLIRSLDERELAGTPVVTIVLEEDGRQLVGSAVLEGGRAYAVGRAVWAALSAR